ncbi:Uncharacterised protein [Mycobacteroides abscessus subsp. abscessus]|nr:Uncharacterised protein [Mycobacteroides abscessus subsp. abscessus]
MASTSRAVSMTAASTHPPDSDPMTGPSAGTIIAAPGSRGTAPLTSTTRANAAVPPPSSTSIRSPSMSFMTAHRLRSR